MADDSNYDPYEFSQGLPDKFGGLIEEAYVAYNPEYQDGKVALLHLTLMTDDPEVGEAGRTTNLYTLGKGWEPSEGGKSAVHESGKKRKLNVNSGVALLTAATLEIGVNLRERGLPWETKTWAGLDFEWERKVFSFGEGESKQEYARMLPVALRGQAPTAAPATTTAPSAAGQTAPVQAPASEPTAPQATTNGAAIGGMEKVALIKLAKEVKANGGSHDTFMEAAFTHESTKAQVGNAAWEQAVMDASGTSIFAQA